MRTALIGLLYVLAFSFAVSGQQPAVTSVTIESNWGLCQDGGESFVFKARRGKIYLGKQVIESKRVNDLLGALRAPEIPTPQASNLGITNDWLRDFAKSVPEDGASNQRALYTDAASSLSVVEQIVPLLFKYIKFDDYPTARVSVEFANGQNWIASSESYYPFMLPWTVSLNDTKRRTFNADISRAITALMIGGSCNNGRLSDEDLKKRLADAVMQHIKTHWDILGVENRAPNSFATLRHDFGIERAEINPHRSNDFGYDDGQPEPHEQNFQALLRRSSLPQNVGDDVVLLFHDGKIEGVDHLANRIAPYEALTFSVPWLNRYLADHPKQNLYIRFVHDRSFSPKAMENFAADMRQLGKESIAAEVAAVQDQAAFVFLDFGSEWIVLPDKRMILWRHAPPATWLKWLDIDFTVQRCADYNVVDAGCIGAIISPEGKIQP